MAPVWRRKSHRSQVVETQTDSSMTSRCSDKKIKISDKTNIPPRGWIDCPAVGEPIDNYIIPSKVPLGESSNEFIEPSKRYSPRQVIEQQRLLSREVGLVIDLTDKKECSSSSLEWKGLGIRYVKIPCIGVPDNKSVNEFVYQVMQFNNQFNCDETQPKKFVLVYSSHGCNRAGYMIVHYLIRSYLMTVSEALQLFQDARPAGIYKPDCIDALYRFYHEEKPEGFVWPGFPEWEKTSGFGCNGGGVCNEVLTNDDVLGDAIPKEQQDFLRQWCCYFLNVSGGANGANKFPGSHPVSLNWDNLQFLRQVDYRVTWKADGTRYMMLVNSDGCYLIDRKFNFRRVQMRFPLAQENGIFSKATHNLTLLDGEMVINTDPETHKQERRYLVFDVMAINGVSVIEWPFGERWNMLEEQVIRPRNLESQCISQSTNPRYRYDREPFSVAIKEFWLLSEITERLKEFTPTLLHGSDGLIFQGWNDKYVPFTHEGLLKWKSHEMNSVDFLVGTGKSPSLYLYDKGRMKCMYGHRVVFTNGEDPSQLSGKIIECSYSGNEVWCFMRVREDKSTPNAYGTYLKVMHSIKDNITEEALLDQIQEIVQSKW
ncbi:hypothetical protein MKW94_011083 [Papaver nudicaule]|uniref:mRNA guanylyltransferase n=1 Tax=Papaver nudicaule TaxID=74823 RepID=A0AA42AZF3_PAPNU|nr:hypothetical protein [Papaver nudicaule]